VVSRLAGVRRLALAVLVGAVAAMPAQAGTGARFSVSTVAWAPGRSIVFGRADRSQTSVGTFVLTRSGARRLTYGRASDPTWSPRGDQVVVNYGGAIASVGPDGSGLRVLRRNAAWPHWSPDGRWIAFYYVDREAVGIMRPDGSGARQVGVMRGDSPAPMAWSPDSRELVFGSSDRGLWVTAIDGSSRQRRRRACPDWGPRGELAYRVRGKVILVFAGGRRRTFVLPICPSWSPNGRRIVASAPGRLPIVVDVRTGRRARIVAPAVDSDFEPQTAWSPDGTRLAFLWPAGRAIAVYVVSARGGRARPVA
jgi:Tol biopolymer transport system component